MNDEGMKIPWTPMVFRVRVWSRGRRWERRARQFYRRRNNVYVSPEVSALWSSVGRRQKGRRS